MTTASLTMTETFLQCCKEPRTSLVLVLTEKIKVNSSILKPCMVVGARLQEKSEQMQDRRLNIYRYTKFSVWLIPMLIIL